jgi:ABC-type amino acid transport substrate-binding protein
MIRYSVVPFLLLLLPLSADADKLDDIKTRGTLLIGATESSPPFSFRDANKGIAANLPHHAGLS